MIVFHQRPHWYALTFEYGLGLVAAWHLAEDLHFGQAKVYSGEFYPWRHTLDMTASHYAILVVVEALALLLFFARVQTRWSAAAIGIVLFIDNLGSYLNHRLLMSLEFLLVSLMPAPAPREVPSYRETATYWNLDLVRFQLSLVYAAAALHKLNDQFLSGRTLANLFWMTHHHGMKQYPEWLRLLLEDPMVCKFLAWSTIATELTLAIGLNFRKTLGPCLLLAIAFHVLLAILMAYIKIFTSLVVISLVVYVPDRTFGGARYLLERRSPFEGPRRFLRLIWPAYIEEGINPGLDVGWALDLPDGTRCTGQAAWVELLSLSPLTMLPAEILRAIPITNRKFRLR